MRSARQFIRSVALGALWAILLSGCAARHIPRPTLDDVVQMSQDGRPAEEIVRVLQQSHAVYPLTASQILSLHENGVDISVLDYLQSEYAARIRHEERMNYQGSFDWNHCFGCYRWPIIVVPK
jgi:hypothetical protein